MTSSGLSPITRTYAMLSLALALGGACGSEEAGTAVFTDTAAQADTTLDTSANTDTPGAGDGSDTAQPDALAPDVPVQNDVDDAADIEAPRSPMADWLAAEGRSCVEPAVLDRRVVWPGAAGLSLRPAQAQDAGAATLSFDSGAVTGVPVVLIGNAGRARVAVTTQSPEGCTVLGLATEGGLVWTAELAGQCGLLAARERALSVPRTNDGVSVIDFLDPEDGAILASVPIPATATTAVIPQRDGGTFSGGSHWLVGAGSRLLRVRLDGLVDDLPIAFPVGRIARRQDALVIASGPEVPGFFQLFDVEDETLTTASDPIATNGAILSGPLVVPCGEIASGGSHWWCPSEAIVFGLVGGGDEPTGAVASFRVEDGSALADIALGTLAPTGLAMLDDGTVMIAGPRWGADVTSVLVPLSGTAAVDSAPVLALGAPLWTGPGAACIGSPVVAAGRLTIAVDSELVTVPTDRTLSRGWSRTTGSERNTGRVQVRRAPTECVGSDTRIFERTYDSPGSPRTRTVLALGQDALLVGSSLGTDTSPIMPWMMRLDPDGEPLWETDLVGYDGVALQDAIAVPGDVSAGGAVGVGTLLDDVSGLTTPYLLHVGDDGLPVKGTAVPFGFDGQLQGVVATDDTFVAAGSGYDGVLPNRQLIIARYAWDLSVVTERFLDIGPGTSADAEALALHPDGGFVLVGSAGGDGLVVRVDDTGAFLSSNLIGDPRLDSFYDVAVDEAGTIFAVGGRALALESAAWLVVVAPDGTLTETLLPGSLAFGLARKPDGGFVVVGEDAILTHLDPFGNPVQALTVGTAPLQKRTLRDVLLPSTGGLLVVGSQHASATTTRPLAIRTDPQGLAPCAASGLCVNEGFGSCDDGNPCTSDRCEPLTGECVSVPLADGALCGVGVCEDGSCVP